jgi:hypothetical protein
MTALLITLAASLPFIALAAGCFLWIHRSRTPLLAKYQVLRVLFYILAICGIITLVAGAFDKNGGMIIPVILFINAVLARVEMQKCQKLLSRR